jgi:hypothetical protein
MSIKVSVTEPCQENWQAMQSRDTGRYCMACQKNVIDFTGMTDREIYRFLHNSQGKVCGRLRKNQMKEYPSPAQASRRLGLHLLALTTFIGLKAATTDEAKAQIPVEQRQPDLSEVARAASSASARVPTAPARVVSGIVFSRDDQTPIPGVNIVVKGTQTGTITDADGNYTLDLSEWNSQTITIVYSFIGYVTVEKQLQVMPEYNLNLELDPDVKGGLVLSYTFPKNILMLPVWLFNKAKCLIKR